jgi:hypothetical protein
MKGFLFSGVVGVGLYAALVIMIAFRVTQSAKNRIMERLGIYARGVLISLR